MRKILICPLNWGLGHASRCIPIIDKLKEKNHIIIASDGEAFLLLKKEFPQLQTLELPSYKIKYAEKGNYFKWKLLLSIPKIARAVLKENKLINLWIKEFEIDAIISDNRLGCYSTQIPSIYMTHQLNVLTGSTTKLSSWAHQYFIKKFDQCWVPDYETEPNLAGKMSHTNNPKLNLIYIGVLSRLQEKKITKKYDLMIVLSGPEPQRSLLEKKLIEEIENFEGTIIFVKGILAQDQEIKHVTKTTYYNFMTSEQIEESYNESEIILCRSGYTSIMDLAKMNKKAFFIPTPGQTEQLYLAHKLMQEGIAPYSFQDDFKIEHLKELSKYKGFSYKETSPDWDLLFSIFEKKNSQALRN